MCLSSECLCELRKCWYPQCTVVEGKHKHWHTDCMALRVFASAGTSKLILFLSVAYKASLSQLCLFSLSATSERKRQQHRDSARCQGHRGSRDFWLPLRSHDCFCPFLHLTPHQHLGQLIHLPWLSYTTGKREREEWGRECAMCSIAADRREKEQGTDSMNLKRKVIIEPLMWRKKGQAMNRTNKTDA